jgi:hypothetical protein
MNDVTELKAFVNNSSLSKDVQDALISMLDLERRDAPITEYATIIRLLADKK